MKQTLKTIAIIIACCILFSCKKEDTSTPGQSFITMKVNGTDWSNDAGEASGFINKSTHTFSITGNKGSDIIAIYIPYVTSTGTYTMTAATTPGSGTFNFSTTPVSIPKNYSVNSSRPASRATISVTGIKAGTSLLDYPQGTFSAVLYTSASDSIVITNGSFKIQ